MKTYYVTIAITYTVTVVINRTTSGPSAVWIGPSLVRC